jgi:hypothetical protein
MAADCLPGDAIYFYSKFGGNGGSPTLTFEGIIIPMNLNDKARAGVSIDLMQPYFYPIIIL